MLHLIVDGYHNLSARKFKGAAKLLSYIDNEAPFTCDIHVNGASCILLKVFHI